MDVWVTIIIKDESYHILLVQAREHDEQWLPFSIHNNTDV